MWIIVLDLVIEVKIERAFGEESAKTLFDKTCKEYPNAKVMMAKVAIEQLPKPF